MYVYRYTYWCQNGRRVYVGPDGVVHPIDLRGNFIIDSPYRYKYATPSFNGVAEALVLAHDWLEFESASGGMWPKAGRNKGGAIRAYVCPRFGQVHFRMPEGHTLYSAPGKAALPREVTIGTPRNNYGRVDYTITNPASTIYTASMHGNKDRVAEAHNVWNSITNIPAYYMNVCNLITAATKRGVLTPNTVAHAMPMLTTQHMNGMPDHNEYYRLQLWTNRANSRASKIEQQWDGDMMTWEYYKLCWLHAWSDDNIKIFHHIYEVKHDPVVGYYYDKDGHQLGYRYSW